MLYLKTIIHKIYSNHIQHCCCANSWFVYIFDLSERLRAWLAVLQVLETGLPQRLIYTLNNVSLYILCNLCKWAIKLLLLLCVSFFIFIAKLLCNKTASNRNLLFCCVVSEVWLIVLKIKMRTFVGCRFLGLSIMTRSHNVLLRIFATGSACVAVSHIFL